MEKIVLSWSTGKDCAMALHEIQNKRMYDVVYLLTTANKNTNRVSRHGVRVELLKKQSESIDIPLNLIYLENSSSNQEYETKMYETLLLIKSKGIRKIAYGDIGRAELRGKRENKLSAIGFEAIFPLWDMNTNELSKSICQNGFKSVITCVDLNTLDKKYVGRIIDEKLLAEFPETVDKCGENGEYHSFVFDGPIFNRKIKYDLGEKELMDNRFYYCDLIYTAGET